jgi:dihydrolipoamide dehydrogenase
MTRNDCSVFDATADHSPRQEPMKNQNAKTTKLAVIGAGPGGYAAAFLGADLGLDVTLIDPGINPGGICLYRGCIPSKALLHAARLIVEAEEARNWGITFGEPKVELDALRNWKNGIVKTLTDGLAQLARQRKVEYIRGRARFVDAQTLHVDRADGTAEMVAFQHAIVATGSRPAQIPGITVDSPRVLDSTGALEIESVPESLLVVGGGYIGLEMGTVYAALGSRVTVVEMLPNLLPGVDADLVTVLRKRIDPMFEAVLLETTVTSMEATKTGVSVRLQPKDREASEMTFDNVLVAVGRKPNSEGLGLEALGVEISKKGFIAVDPSRSTRLPSILAIGDVVGEPMLAHKASHEGRIAAEVAAGRKAAFEPLAIPTVIFTDPEIAVCGLTEREARETNREIKVARFPWAASGRAKTLGRSDGVTKLVIDPSSERVLGVGIVGPGAGELVAEGVLAVEMGATARDVGLTIHPHPTLSETLMEAAEVFFGQSTHLYRPAKR